MYVADTPIIYDEKISYTLLITLIYYVNSQCDKNLIENFQFYILFTKGNNGSTQRSIIQKTFMRWTFYSWIPITKKYEIWFIPYARDIISSLHKLKPLFKSNHCLENYSLREIFTKGLIRKIPNSENLYIN